MYGTFNQPDLINIAKYLDHRTGVFTSPQEDNADHTVTCCEEFAQHFARKIVQICSDLDAVIVSGPVNKTMAPACSVLMDEFQFLQPDDVVRILGEVMATTCLPDPCLPWLIKTARKGLVEWVGGVTNVSLHQGRIPSCLRRQ